MLTTLREILETKGVSLQDTIYCRAVDAIQDFPMNIGDFFKLTKDGAGVSNFEPLNRLYALAESKKKTGEYRAICDEFQQIKDRLKEMSRENNTDELIAEKTSLRSRKKKLSVEKKALEEGYVTQAIEESKKECDFGLTFLEYKNTFYCSNFAEIAAKLPQIETVNTPKLKGMPLFVRGIDELSQTVKKGAPLGIVGGPCLFGAYEVTIDVHHKDGQVVQFDFSTGRQYDDHDLLIDFGFESYLTTRYEDISRLELKNNKSGVTYQEYLSMLYLFEFALVLGAKVMIPIPDMSYMKFFKGATELVADEVKKPAFKAFEKISYDIADMYIKIIDDLRSRYPKVECQVLHSRDTKLCELFYERRGHYIDKLYHMGKLTANKGKTDAIIDYITMLALPFYIYGTRNLLQIDSVDEADSMRKCMKVHGSDVTFHSILFPEYLSGDGVHAVFYAPPEFKEYINFGGQHVINTETRELVHSQEA